ncbi:MAG: iron-containing alcohol dehydrogenase [Nocardiopsaceae bacterium]|jgi:alcohol dehydrogenase|nr:iron-containing alcohol dehydrogenase [Nocardiopsaceae bacterium]
MRVGFIGLGRMGGPMSSNLLAAGHDLIVHDSRESAARPLIEAGAAWAATPCLAAAGREVVITSLPAPRDVELVLLAEGGLLAGLEPGSIWVDMSTSVPEVAERVRALAEPHGVAVMDAPVSGMTTGARAGTLQIFVGGTEQDYRRVRPLLEAMGDPDRIRHVGPHGAGYTVKLMLNLLWFAHVCATAEVLSMGVAAGVDVGTLRESLLASPAASHFVEADVLSVLRDGDYDEGFALALACKDLGLAIDLARATGVPAEVSALVEQIYRRALAQYGGTGGEMLPIRLLEDLTGTRLRLNIGTEAGGHVTEALVADGTGVASAVAAGPVAASTGVASAAAVSTETVAAFASAPEPIPAQELPMAESLSGQSLSGQSLPGQSLPGQGLSGQSLSDQYLDIGARPTAHFGTGSLAKLGQAASATGGAGAVIVTDAGMIATPVIGAVRAELDEAGIPSIVFSGVHANPATDDVAAGAEMVAGFAPAGQSVLVAVGGGSSIDAAKGIALAAVNPERGRALDYNNQFAARGVPIVAVPTTAGTGAETNAFGVITDPLTRTKFYVGHTSTMPAAAILDPALTVGLPAAPTAATGIDALTHAIESFLSVRANPWADGIALQVIKMIAAHLERACADGADAEARAQMLLASHMAGIGMATTGLGMVHAIGHALGGRYDIAHGVSLAVVLPEVLEFSAPARPDRMAAIASALGAADSGKDSGWNAVAAIDAVRALRAQVGLDVTVAGIGADASDFAAIAADALADEVLANAPRQPDAADIEAVLAAAGASV